MGNMEKIIGIITALIGSGISFLFGEYHVTLAILGVIVALDIFLGMSKAVLVGNGLRSKTLREGLLRKAIYSVPIILMNLFDIMLGNQEPILRNIAVYFYIGVEALSIIENLGLIGVPFPKQLKNIIEQLNNRNGSNDDNNN